MKRIPNWAMKRLKEGLSHLLDYCERWGIGINNDKNKFLLFTRPGKPCRTTLITVIRSETKLSINGRQIPTYKEIKYLGAHFMNILKLKRHVDKKIRKANATYGLIASLMRLRQGLSMTVKQLLYKQLIRGIPTKCFPVRCTINQSSMNRVLTKERKTHYYNMYCKIFSI